MNLALIAALLGGFVWFTQPNMPRVWRVNELPVAFWAWQNEIPNRLEVQIAIQSLNTTAIFMRAGQIDYEKLKPRRIREPQGKFPRSIDLHLVYNATRSMLSEFETLRTDELAETIVGAFQDDCKRALRDVCNSISMCQPAYFRTMQN